MTLSRRPDGLWELRTREGQLAGAGALTAMIARRDRMRRDGWSTVPFGQPSRTIDGRLTVECTEAYRCDCRACSHDALGA